MPPRSFLAAICTTALLAFAACSSAPNEVVFPNVLGEKPALQTVQMKHGLTVMMVDADPARRDATFTIRFKGPEPLAWTLWDGAYQDQIVSPDVTIGEETVHMTAPISGTHTERTLSIKVHKEPGRETRSSHQVRFEIFANGSMTDETPTPVELEIQGSPGARWDLLQHAGLERAGAK